MWQIDNRTPFAAGQSWVRNLDGAETWLVVVKATFDVQRGGATVPSKEQPEVTRAPVYRGEPGQSSIVYENDFVLAKQTTDVLLNGSAYAPGRGEISQIDVTMEVGPVRKTLRVYGDRSWKGTGSAVGPPKPFTQMPITYERAFGGADKGSPQPEVDWYWPNPVGMGFVAARGRAENTRPPNVEYPDQVVGSWKSRPAPAGFGVIGSHWQERSALAGTYDAQWSETRQPLLPADFDIRHYQAAPADQRPAKFLSGGERVALTNLTPSGSLRFALPSLSLRFETRYMDGERVAHPAPNLHTVILEPDYPRVSLVWHTALECHARVYQLEVTRIELPDEDGEYEVSNLLDLV